MIATIVVPTSLLRHLIIPLIVLLTLSVTVPLTHSEARWRRSTQRRSTQLIRERITDGAPPPLLTDGAPTPLIQLCLQVHAIKR